MSDPGYVNAVRLVWIPYPEHGGFCGRLVVRRVVAAGSWAGSGEGGGGDPVAEVWLSPLVDEAALFTETPANASDEWRELILGRPLSSLTAVIDLRPATATELREILARLHSTDRQAPRALLGFDAALDRRQGDQTVRAAHIHLASADLLAQMLRPLFDEAVAGLRRVDRTSDGVADRPDEDLTRIRSRSLEQDLAACIRLHDVRGAVIGNQNRQIDRYVVVAKPGVVSFEEVLGRPDVMAALHRLQQTPDDGRHRQALIDALSGSFQITRDPAKLVVTGPADHGLEDFLRSLFTFRARGLQVGDHNTQINDFTYVVPTTPNAAELLRASPHLASALADVLCPRTGEEPNVAELDARYRSVLEGLKLQYRDGRDRAVQHAWPQHDAVLRLNSIDGVMVGDENRLSRTDTVRVKSLAFTDLQQVWERAEQEREAVIAREQKIARESRLAREAKIAHEAEVARQAQRVRHEHAVRQQIQAPSMGW